MQLVAPFFALIVWQIIAASGLVPAFILPGPLSVTCALWDNAALLRDHCLITLSEVGLGLAIGGGLGFVFAIVMMLWPAMHKGLRPFLTASQAIPVFVLAPIMTLWFGYGMAPKVTMTILLVFFPIASGLLDGCSPPLPW